MALLRNPDALKQHRSSYSLREGIVRFKEVDQSNDVHMTYSRKDLCPSEAEEIWFSRKEIKMIAKRNKNLALACNRTIPRRHSMSTSHSDSTEMQDENSYSSCCYNLTEEERIAALQDDTCRGLENLINPLQRRSARERKKSVKSAVLDEQARQVEECECNPLMLAKVANHASKYSQTQALFQARLDAEEAWNPNLIAIDNSVPLQKTTQRQSKARSLNTNHKVDQEFCQIMAAMQQQDLRNHLHEGTALGNVFVSMTA